MSIRLAGGLAIVAVAFVLARTVAVTTSLTIAANEQTDRLQALEQVPKGARVLSLVGAPCARHGWALWRNNHLGGMTVARREGFSNSHWEVPGARLMTVIYQQAGAYRYDPSQSVRAASCGWRVHRTIDNALQTFPRGAFDYVWLIDPPEYDPRLLAGAQLVFRGHGTLLYRLRPSDGAKVAR